MKIVFVVPDMIGGGTERIVSLLANEYAKRGIETAVMLFAGETVEYALDKRIEVIKTGTPSGGKLSVRLKRMKAMRDYYNKNRDCVIFAFSVMGTVFSVAATLGARHRMLVSERSNPEEYEHKRIRNFFYGFADRLVFQTEDAMKSFRRTILRKSVVVPNPVNPDLPPAYEGIRNKKIAAVGRLEEVKNYALLIESFAEFKREHQEYTLELYGKGTQENILRALAEKLNLSEEIHFHGFCKDVQEKIRDSAMFVLSSNYEGISNAMIEAIAMGIPVIATDCPVGGTRMYMEDGVNGLIVPVKDKSAMAAAMKRIASNAEFASAISENGIKIREQFSIEIIADKLLQIMGMDGEGKQDANINH